MTDQPMEYKKFYVCKMCRIDRKDEDSYSLFNESRSEQGRGSCRSPLALGGYFGEILSEQREGLPEVVLSYNLPFNIFSYLPESVFLITELNEYEKKKFEEGLAGKLVEISKNRLGSENTS